MGNSCGGSGSAPKGSHCIYVTTGDKKGAGTNANVFLSLTDASGTWSEEKKLDNSMKNDLEQGHTDTFGMDCPELKKITDICIRRDETGANDNWLVEKITVVHMLSKTQSVFPVNRWINAGSKICLSEFDSVLPQLDKNDEQRKMEMDKKRELYRLKSNGAGMPYQIDTLPDDEQFSSDYQWDIVKLKAEMKIKLGFTLFTTPHFETLEDFKKMFKLDSVHLPSGLENWRSDEHFGYQRMAGCNPAVLRLCSAVPSHMPVTNDMLAPFLEGQALDDCLAAKKVYIVDYTYMVDIEFLENQKLPGPTALFYSKKNGDLVPIAIQLMPVPADDNPIFLPSDPEYTWLSAKMWFNLTDASHHQAVSHLGYTHLVMESVAVTAHRQLSPSHPVFRLMAPHFLYLMSINFLAINKLISPGGWVDQVLQMGSDGMLKIIKRNWSEWDIKSYGNLPGDLKARGVDDTEALPNYHYRDDGLLLWDAIIKYVTTVINSVYDTPEKLANDNEVQAWMKELIEVDFTSLPGALKTNEELIETVSTFIYTCSCVHAAVNFAQYDEYAFSPNYPASLKGERPKDKTPLTEKDIVDAMPTKEQCAGTIVVTSLLSRRGTQPLGDFEIQYAYDPVSMKALEELKKDLAQISKTIDGRNKTRKVKYDTLHPSEVPNAISI